MVLHSGGLDSTVLLTKLVRDGYDCYPLTVNYGQRHVKEAAAAFLVCDYLGLWGVWRQLDLDNLSHFIHSALSGDGEIPYGHYEAESQKATVFPNRNMILLGIAAGYAETIGASFVAYAAHSNDRAIYPDCRPEFVKSAAETLRLGTDGKVRLVEPFVDMKKTEIAKLGVELGAPLELTWSCYKGGERPCLQCGTCLERTEAFHLSHTTDPALTAEEWRQALKYLEQYTR